ncbi:MAG: signal peptidase I [Pyrinomonadaceae bacterium]
MRLKFVAVTVGVLIASCGYVGLHHAVGVTRSMSPTIEIGDHMSIFGIKDNDVDPIARFDIVGYHRAPDAKRGIDEKTIFIHRIIGLPGETVELRNGTVFINGKELDESSFDKVPATENRKLVSVSAGEYFLLGDNRPESEDSRYTGTIGRSAIEGKVSNIIRKADYDAGKRW